MALTLSRLCCLRHKLAGVELEIPENSDLSEIGASIGLLTEAQAIDEADNYYPGLAVKTDGFVPIGQDLTGGGDPYFINANDDAPGPGSIVFITTRWMTVTTTVMTRSMRY